MRGFHIRISVSSTPNDSSTFLPRDILGKLPSHQPAPTARKNATFNPKAKDYRFGPIRIDWLDKMSQISSGKQKDHGPAVAKFVPLDEQGSTNLPQGVVQLFRESGPPPAGTSKSQPDAGGVMLGVLAVPAYMNPSDFLTFVAPAADSISHLRMIRDSMPNRSLIVINFTNTEDAAAFIEEYNGKPFNSVEPEICHVVRVLSVEVDVNDHVSQSISRIATGHAPASELPTCPVCLERMDSAVTGLITVPCSHTFHCMCLSKWGDSRCPVCRYSQNLLSSHPASSSSSSRTIPFSTPTTTPLSTCSSCASTTNLWICLICGNIGCGRYGRAHAQEHYQHTTHLYALELETQRVWDYAGDGYVHRLIQNKADGKLVELPSASASMGATGTRSVGLGPGPSDALSAEKIEAIGIEYSYLLTSQLDSQRAYYEEQTSELQTQVGELRDMMAHLTGELQMAKTQWTSEMKAKQDEEEARTAELRKDKARAETRAESMSQLARNLKKELDEERAVSKGLMKNLGKMKEKVEAGDAQKRESEAKMKELEDQLRDVMFFLEAQDKIQKGEGPVSEAQGGSLEIRQGKKGKR
ncbi:BRCA1-associated protein [Cylindrobasidium torrendii FP15055 ss-10]|uniref:BRCA1-associated protein n=1 Tax=Cylindrobasidium torrendii FP15055 ss-10 TaxID=1314674 RepID=A0A0D7AVG9_9AGAR|nr:BRCA1-associated protein [Cylindrobasidium torrendii FP15055 ss-10]